MHTEAFASIDWLEPWARVSEDRARELEQELRREVSSGHVLHGREAKAIAARSDRDDVLFAVSGPDELAVVHLSYRKEASPAWPSCMVFESVGDFVDGCLVPDHLEHTDADADDDDHDA